MNNFETVVDPTEALRSAFRRHASGVSVITMSDATGNPAGFTATSMTSLGATPPLVTFNISTGSSSWPILNQTKHVAIHTLGDQNLELAQRMAADHTLRFTKNDWFKGPNDLPIFSAATAVLICEIREILNVENNAVVVLRVLEGMLGQDTPALLYHQRRYMSQGKNLS